MVFCIRDMEIAYFNLGVNPIFRESYMLGAGAISPKGYEITDARVGCGICAAGCPQRAIAEGTPYRIEAGALPALRPLRGELPGKGHQEVIR